MALLTALPAASALVPASAPTPEAEPRQGAATLAVDRAAAQAASRSWEREPLPERALARPTAAPKPAPTRKASPRARVSAVGTWWATTALDVRATPAKDARVLATIAAGERIGVTKVVRGAYRQVVWKGRAAWVTDEWLSARKPEEPEPEQPAGISAAPCPSGSSVESGLTPDAIGVHRAVCAAFSSITSYGGLRGGDTAHATGQALDIMVSGDLGYEVAEWLRARAGELGVSELLYAQRIWTVERSSEGWRPLEDRGSVTANHYDHVHVTVYGNAAG